MFFVALFACWNAPTPPALDVRAALANGACGPERVVAGTRLAVFEGDAPELAVNVVLADGLFVDGVEVTPETLGPLLREKAKTARSLAGGGLGFDGSLLLQVAVEVPARRVVEVLHTAHGAGFTAVQFVGRSAVRAPVVEPADPVFDAAIRAARAEPPRRRQQALHDVTGGVMASCPRVPAAMEAARAQDRVLGCDEVVQLLEGAFTQCPEADVRKIVTLFQQVPSGPMETLTMFRQVQDPGATVRTVEPGTRWETWVSRVRAAGGTAWWVVGP